MGVDRSSLSSPGVARSAARTTGDGLAVVRQQPTSPGNHCDQIDDFGSCNLDSIHQGGPIFEGPTCSPSRQERMILSRIFSSGEPGPQLTWTAMIADLRFRWVGQRSAVGPPQTSQPMLNGNSSYGSKT